MFASYWILRDSDASQVPIARHNTLQRTTDSERHAEVFRIHQGDPAVPSRVDAQGHLDVYGKLLHAFQNPLYVAVYCAGQLVLGMHLSHAVSSSLQTLGLEHAAWNRVFKAAGPAVALLVVCGNLSIILAVFLGMIRP